MNSIPAPSVDGATSAVAEKPRRSETGDTLIEVLIALVVLGLASVALLLAFSTTIAASAEHRQLATANIVLGSASQQAIAGIEADITLFQTCPNGQNAILTSFQSALSLSGFSVPAPYNAQPYNDTVAVTGVQYWSTTNANFTPSCATDVPEEITITVSDGETHQQYYNSFVVDYPLASANSIANTGSPTQLVFTTQPSSTTSGGLPLTSQPQVKIEDQNSNPVATDLSPVVLSIASGPSGATLTGCLGNEVNGVVTFSGCTIDLPNNGTSGTFTLQATDSSLLPLPDSVASSSFTISGSADSLIFTTSPTAGISGALFGPQPVIKVEDSNGNVISWTGSISLASSGGVLSSCSNLSTTNGIIAVAGCTFEGAYVYNASTGQYLGTPYTLTATATGLATGTSAAFAVTGPGTASQLVFTTEPSGVASLNPNTHFPTQPVVTAEDAFDNVVFSYSTKVSLAMTTNNQGVALEGCTTSITPSGGVATFSGCFGNTIGTGLTLTASSGGLSATSTPFNITGPPTSMSFTQEPVAGPSGAAFAIEPIITLYDATGKVATASTTAITLSTTGGSLSLCSNLTPVNGVVNVETCAFAGMDNTPTGYSMIAQQGSVMAESTSFSPSGPGIATQLVFTTPAPVAGASESVFTTQPTVSVEDSAGNVVTTSSATISLTTSGGALPGGTLSSCSNLTAVTGIVDVANCTFAGVVNHTYALTASSPGLISATTSIVPTGPGKAVSVAITPSPNSAMASSTTNEALTLQVQDQYDNATASPSSTNLTLSTSSSKGFFSATNGGLGALGGTINVTIPANGSGTATIYYGDETAGTPTITAMNSLANWGAGTVTITASTPASIAVTSGSGQSATVNTAFTNKLVATVTDTFGNLVSGANVAFTAPSSGASANFSGSSTNTVATGSNGQATSGTLTAGTVAGSYNITAGVTGVIGTVNFAGTNTAGTPANITVTSGSGQSATVNTTFTNKLVATVTDSFGNLVSGATVTFTVPGSGASASFTAGNTATTGSNGQATSGTLTAGTTAGSYNISASPGGTASPVNFAETNTAGAANKLAITSTAVSGTASSTANLGPITVSLEDSFGNLTNAGVGGESVTLSSSSTGTAIFATSLNGTGVTSISIPSGSSSTTFFYGDTKAASPTITVAHATTPALTSGTQVETITGGTPANITVTSGSGQSATVNTTFTNKLVATVTDSFGNLVSGATVTFTVPGSGASASFTAGNTATTGSNGQATSGTLTAGTTAGSYNISASPGGTASPVNFAETNTAGAANKLAITSTAVSGTASSTANLGPITVSLEDSFGNLTNAGVGGESVTLSSSSTGTAIFATSLNGTGVTSVSIPSGSSSTTFFYGDTKAASPTITVAHATTPALTSGTQVETITAGAANKLAITSTAVSGTASSTANLGPITVSLEDSFGNLTNAGVGGESVTLSSSSTGTAIFATSLNGTGVTSVSIPSGSSSTTFFYGDTKAASPTITVAHATTPALTSGTQVETITAGAANKLAITSTAVSGTASSTANLGPITVSLEDSFGNLTNAGVGGESVTLSSSSTGTAIFATSLNGTGVTSVSIPSGSSSTTFFYGDTKAASPTITVAHATTPALTSGTQVETITAGAANKLAITSTAVSGTASSTANLGPITVSLEDSFGNLTNAGVGGESVTLSSSSTGTAIFATSLNGTGVTSVSIPSGSSSTTFFYGDTKAASPTITVAHATTPALTSGTQVETITAGAANKLAITSTAVSGTASSTANLGPITVSLEDSFGNLTNAGVGGESVTLSSSSTGTAIFATSLNGTGVTSVSIPSGSSSTTFFYGDTKAASPTITVAHATTPALTSGTQVETITGGTPANITVTSGSGQSATVNTTFTNKLVATVTDSFGNLVSGATVTFTVPGSGASASFTAGNTATTGSNGQATSGTLTAGTTAGSYNISASPGGTASPVNFAETNTAGAANKLAITSTAVSGTASSTANLGPITVSLEDSFGNLTNAGVGGESVTLSSSSTGTAIFATSLNGTGVTSVSIPSGSSSTTFFYGDTKAASPTITVAHATTPALTSGTQVETITGGAASHIVFVNCSLPAGNTTCGSQPISLGNNGAMTFDIQVQDSFGNATSPTATVTVTFANSDGTFSITGSPATINSSATTSATVTLHHGVNGGTDTLTASDSSLQFANITLTASK